MKPFLSITTYLLLLLFLYSLSSCSDISNPIDNNKIEAGITGVITDTSGVPLENVKVYCLYYTPSIPTNPTRSNSMVQILDKNDYSFNLEQNFPNPFSNSTFLRFSIPNTSHVDLELYSSITGNTISLFSKEFQTGYFQYYLNNIVDSLKLMNGLYSYTLRAVTQDSVFYSDKKDLFIISDKGKPNSETDMQGNYAFDYNYALVGDTLEISYTENYSFNYQLDNTIYLLFEKDGYLPKIALTTLYSGIVLNHDVVLIKE